MRRKFYSPVLHARAIQILVLALFALRPLPARGTIAVHLAPATAWRECGQGVEMRVSSALPTQGSLLVVEARSSKQITELHGDWAGQKLIFWRDTDDETIYRGLLGVDLEKPAAAYQLTLSAQGENGTTSCSVSLTVHAGRFAEERLRVAQQFAEPSAADLERANRERKRLRELYSTTTPERLWVGSFGLPLDISRKGGNFGRRRILNGEPGSPHSGVDFPAPSGSPVHASQRGRVVLAENLFFSGNTVLLDHGLGTYTLYAHFESIAVALGDLAEKGTILGRVGATGRVTGPHLHWGLVVNGARVNPLQIVTLLGSSRKLAMNDSGKTKTRRPGKKTKTKPPY